VVVVSGNDDLLDGVCFSSVELVAVSDRVCRQRMSDIVGCDWGDEKQL